ncbi:MAG: nitrogen fixation protein FixH [Burkholderiaceae bacterium]
MNTKPTKAVLEADTTPWWKQPMCWVVIGGPASVVVASLATAVIAWKHIDPIIQEDRSGASKVTLEGPPGSATGPALQGRNHAASPVAVPATTSKP